MNETYHNKSAIMLNVNMLSVVMLNVVMPNVVAPIKTNRTTTLHFNGWPNLAKTWVLLTGVNVKKLFTIVMREWAQ